MSFRILIVSDNELNAKLLAAKLVHEYFVVETAADGFEALAKIKAEKPDIVLLEIWAPGFDGFETCRRIKADPTMTDIRVIMVTALADDAYRTKGLEAGADDFLPSSIPDYVLMARIRSQLRLKRMRDQWLQRDADVRDGVVTADERFVSSLSLTDELTDLYNRRYLLAHLDELIDRVNQDGISAAVLLLDIDHFKQINDTYGHAAGDDVLRDLAARTMNSVRNVDLVARLGGEEFVVVMPDTDITNATAVAEQLRAAVANGPFVVRASGKELAVTISIGVAATTGGGDSRDELLKRADAALCEAKRAGRNRVVADGGGEPPAHGVTHAVIAGSYRSPIGRLYFHLVATTGSHPNGHAAADAAIASTLGLAPLPYTADDDAAQTLIPSGWSWGTSAAGTPICVRDADGHATAGDVYDAQQGNLISIPSPLTRCIAAVSALRFIAREEWDRQKGR